MGIQVVCQFQGRVSTRMWTEWKIYPATVSGPREGNLRVIDDLGHERILSNTERPTFPMGTGGWLGPVYTAIFIREITP